VETYSALCSSAISVTTECVLPIPDQVLPPFGAIIVAFNMGSLVRSPFACTDYVVTVAWVIQDRTRNALRNDELTILFPQFSVNSR